jgi:hypothetical protein
MFYVIKSEMRAEQVKSKEIGQKWLDEVFFTSPLPVNGRMSLGFWWGDAGWSDPRRLSRDQPNMAEQ